MVRPKKQGQPLPADTPNLEDGGQYGITGDQRQAMTDMPLLTQKPDLTTGETVGNVASPVAMGDPMEEASSFPNTATPLTAPGNNLRSTARPLVIDAQVHTANLLKSWAEDSGNPAVMNASMQQDINLLINPEIQ